MNFGIPFVWGVLEPKTVILPSRDLPADTSEESFSNLAYPMDWEGIFDYIGFPAYMKPFSGGGWKSVYQLNSMEEFFEKHAETEQLVMMLQEEIKFDESVTALQLLVRIYYLKHTQ